MPWMQVAAAAALLWGASAPPVAAQTLYKSVGPDGRIVYSDRPPVEGRVDKTMSFENLPSSPVPAATLSYVEQLRRLREASPPPVEGVVLYSATWCGFCRKAKAYLAAKGVTYQEFDIDTPAGRSAYAQAGGGKGVPLLFAKGQRLQGFSATAYDSVFGTGR
jgi:glutaredoxin